MTGLFRQILLIIAMNVIRLDDLSAENERTRATSCCGFCHFAPLRRSAQKKLLLRIRNSSLMGVLNTSSETVARAVVRRPSARRTA